MGEGERCGGRFLVGAELLGVAFWARVFQVGRGF